MNMIICGEPCIHQHDGCCGLHGAGVINQHDRLALPLFLTEGGRLL
ncbi:MAG: hypothetical protein ACLTZI_15655 [[Eubacterium] siraeum]